MALTVTFLMPVFGMLWGFFILKERITGTMVFGALAILAGTFFGAVPKNVKKTGAAPPPGAVSRPPRGPRAV